MSTPAALAVSLVLLVGNAFFVAAEFALTASRPHRLARLARDGSRGARAALRGTRELSLMLAGAQLGITLCSLGLGALAEPAIAHLVGPALHAVGLPAAVAYGIGFVLALAFITFVHIVVGEMAPKSAVISHPETSARALGLPFRAFTWLARPGLAVLNGAANLALRLVRVTPVAELDATRDPVELRALLRRSYDAGLLPADQYRTLDGTLALRATSVDTLMCPRDRMVTVPADAVPADIQDAHLRTGRSRFPVTAPDGSVVGVVHVRHTLVADGATARELARPPLVLSAGTDTYAALATMRGPPDAPGARPRRRPGGRPGHAGGPGGTAHRRVRRRDRPARPAVAVTRGRVSSPTPRSRVAARRVPPRSTGARGPAAAGPT